MTIRTTYNYIESKTTTGVIRIYIDDILFAELSGRYCFIHHNEGCNFFRITIKELEDKYPNIFIRCGKQLLVSLKKITKVNRDVFPANIEIEGYEDIIDISCEKAQEIEFLVEKELHPKQKIKPKDRQDWIIRYLERNDKASTLLDDFVTKYLDNFDVKKEGTGYRIPRVPTLNYDLGVLLKKGRVVRYTENTDDSLVLDGFPYKTRWFKLNKANG